MPMRQLPIMQQQLQPLVATVVLVTDSEGDPTISFTVFLL